MQGGLALVKDIGAYLKAKFAGVARATAGGTGDNTEVDGASIDLTAIGYPKSAKLLIAWSATLAEGATLNIAYNMQQYNGSTWGDVGTVVTTNVVGTGGSGGSTETGVVEVDIDLTTFSYNTIRAQFTPNLSAANTDVATLGAVLVFGGQAELPV